MNRALTSDRRRWLDKITASGLFDRTITVHDGIRQIVESAREFPGRDETTILVANPSEVALMIGGCTIRFDADTVEDTIRVAGMLVDAVETVTTNSPRLVWAIVESLRPFGFTARVEFHDDDDARTVSV